MKVVVEGDGSPQTEFKKGSLVKHKETGDIYLCCVTYPHGDFLVRVGDGSVWSLGSERGNAFAGREREFVNLPHNTITISKE